MQSRQRAWIDFLKRELTDLMGLEVELQVGIDMYRLIVPEGPSSEAIRLAMRALLRDGPEAFFQHPRVLVADSLSVMFLACGSLADPEETYQIDFSLTRMGAANFAKDLLALVGLDFASIQHRAYQVLYAKDGGKIAEFLARAGAHRALLEFENLRVQKELRNQVNRIVNCDNANAERQAGSSAKQWAAIHYLDQVEGLDALPDDLKEAAIQRVKNPGLSLRDLGALMRPVLGKSGMNHRMQRLMERAERLKEQRGDC